MGENLKKSASDKIGEINSLRLAEKTHEQGIKDNLTDLIIMIQESELAAVIRILAEHDIIDAEWSVARSDWSVMLMVGEGKTFMFSSKYGVGILNPSDGDLTEVETSKLELATCEALNQALENVIDNIHHNYQAYLKNVAPHLLTILDYAPKPIGWKE